MYTRVASALNNKADRSNVVTSVNNLNGHISITNAHDGIGGNFDTSLFSGHTTIIKDNSNILLYDGYVHRESQYISQLSLPGDCVRVENNFMYDSSNEVIRQIKPERFISGFYALEASGLTSWVGDMPNLESAYVQGRGMFDDNSSLTTFIGDLSSLTDGHKMFYYCIALTTFIGDLSSLTDGDRMFGETQLSVESVEIIADTLPEITNSATMTIFLHTPPSSTTELTAYMTAMSPIVDKGWNLYTNSEIANLFDTTKYSVSGNEV